MSNRLPITALVLAALALSGRSAKAQITIDDIASLSAGGDLSFGYSGTNGNSTISNHSLGLGGHGWLRGFYYKPQFLSFDFQPYYRRAQNDSIYQTITNGSGFTANTSIFSGSHFPGFVSYSRTYDNTGQFGVPGIEGVTSHGNGGTFAVGWSALLPHLPTLSASYATNTGESSVYGANTYSTGNSRDFTLQSTYSLAGFQLLGQYIHLSTDSNFPTLLENQGTIVSTTRSNQFLVNAGHKLPLAGNWNLVWNRTNYTGDYRTGDVRGSNDGVVNDVNTLFSINPTRKLGLSFGADYNDNAFGALQQQILETGGVPFPQLRSTLRIFSFNGQAGYSLTSYLALYARATRYEQWYSGTHRGMTQFSGNANFNFSRPLLGALTFSVGLMDTATEEGNSGASLFGNVNYLRRYRAWEFGADFGYTQQVQTLFDVYTTSTFRYGGQVRRRFRWMQWTNAFNGSHSGMTRYSGYNSRSETLSETLAFRRFSLNGLYSQSEGTSIFTSAGLVEVPPGVPLPLVSQPIFYNGRSYGGGASVMPFRRFTLYANYDRARSSTAGPTIAAGFQSTIFNARMQYRLRKLYLDANYTQFRQNIAMATLPARINTYFFRVSRWFNLF